MERDSQMPQPASQARGNILVCDDSLEEIRVLVGMLKRAHYRLSISTNGKDACIRASVLQPDLILMDVRMPMMDGFAACRVLKAHPDTRDIPLIFLTAANEVEDRIEGLKLGGVDYIVKPADEEEVLLRVGVHVSRRANSAASTEPQTLLVEANQPYAALVEATCRMLENQLSEALSIDEISSKVGTHRHRLTSAFKSAFGTTVFGWLRERRMQQAADWLKHTNMDIEGIAQELGFVSPGNFSTAFRLRFGMAPRDYRRSMSGPAMLGRVEARSLPSALGELA
jgi:DNA-binding response OmpR family regulator